MRKTRTPAQEALRQLRREQIVAAARDVVANAGVDALTIGSLERRLGFTRGVITYHFRDKEEIVDAVLQSALQEIDAATHAEVAKSANAYDRVRAVLRANLHGFLEQREAGAILLSFWGRLGSDAKARKANARLYAVYRERTLSVLDSSEFYNIDRAALAAVIVGLVLGIAAQVYFEPGSVDPEAALTEATRCVVARLSGATART